MPETQRLESEKTGPRGQVRGAMVLQWQEHCIECAVPLCYSTCPLYVQRRDRKCARLVYGIVRNPEFSGLLNAGADLRFRRWGKIETTLTGRFLSLRAIRFLDKLDRALTAVVNSFSNLLSGISPKRRLNGALTLYRAMLLNHIGRRAVRFDAFAVECYSFESAPCRVIVELVKNDSPVYREGLDLHFGYNYFQLPVPLPPEFGHKDCYRLLVFPDADKEIRLVFTWLDFVAFKTPASEKAPQVSTRPADIVQPAAKVKCVAWDLDNTLWQGTLIEDGAGKVRIRPEAERLVRWLDERGIIQTIVSKNNHDEAMEVLSRSGLVDYFLYPAINWGQKSASLLQIADRLNINIDTFGLIDDSPFERMEVAETLPMVRVYTDRFDDLAGLPEFDVPITEASRLRRKSYLTEIEREKAQEVFGSNYLEFLRSCHLRLRLFPPSTASEIARCHELVQRSNQLNLSSRRYNQDEFRTLLADGNMLTVAMECEDKFGHYGTVGFASIDCSGEDPVARDFVLSCRVAQKHVEHAFYRWLAERFRQQGNRRLLVELIKTTRNSPLVKVFDELPFTVVREEGDAVLFSMNLECDFGAEDVVAVNASALEPRSVS